MSNKQKRSQNQPSIPTAKLFDNMDDSPEIANQQHLQVVIDLLPIDPGSKEAGDELIKALGEVLEKYAPNYGASIKANQHRIGKCTVISCIYLQPLIHKLDEVVHDATGTEH